MPDRERKRVSEHRSDVPKGRISPPGGLLPILVTRKMRVSEAERREREESSDQAAQRGLQEPCTTDIQKKRGKNTEGGKKRRREIKPEINTTHTHSHAHTHTHTHPRTHARTHTHTTFPEADLRTEGAA